MYRWRLLQSYHHTISNHTICAVIAASVTDAADAAADTAADTAADIAAAAIPGGVSPVS